MDGQSNRPCMRWSTLRAVWQPGATENSREGALDGRDASKAVADRVHKATQRLEEVDGPGGSVESGVVWSALRSREDEKPDRE